MSRSVVLFLLICSFFSTSFGLTSYKDPDVTRFFNRTSGWIASDAAFSIKLSDNNSLWLFGDTYLDDLAKDGTTPCLFEARNTMMLQNNRNWDPKTSLVFYGNKATTHFKSFFKLEQPEEDFWFWPWSGFQINQTIYVYLSRFRSTGCCILNCSMCFESLNQDYWALINYPDIGQPRLVKLEKFGDIRFGNGFIDDVGDGYIYSYGQTQGNMTTNNFVGRFPAGNPFGKWQFWDGKTWNGDVKKAEIIASGVDGSVFVTKIRDKIVMFATELSLGCDQGKRIFASVADNTTGPFSKRKLVYTLQKDDTVDGHYPFFYQVVAHPQFINNKNELLVTYCINHYETCLPFCVSGRTWPVRYRPRGVRVNVDYLLG